MGARRFAITASDRYVGVFNGFLESGWEPVKLFSAPTFDHMASTTQVLALAQKHRIPVQMSRMEAADLADLSARGCELLVVASYQWRIGNWKPYMERAINFHPAPLPFFRGPYPMVQGILGGEKRWATTCHQLDPEFDTGAVLAARQYDISANECHESLDLKTQIETYQLGRAVATDLDALWDNAVPQGAGRYVPFWTDADRTLNFQECAADIDRRLRAFGNFECLATVNNMTYYVRRAACWTVGHNVAPGVLVHSDGARLVVACVDGFVALLDWSLVPPGVRMHSPVR